MKKLITLILVAVLMIGFAVVADAAVGTVVYGYKTNEAPNMEEIDESWGEPVAYITKDSPNAELAKYWTVANDTCNGEHGGTGPNGRTTIEPEDSDFWLYVRYDNKYIYVGFKSPDYEICGSETKHRGDGIHLWLQPLDAMADPTGSSCGRAVTSEYDSDGLSAMYYFFWNLAFDDYSVDFGNASVNLDESPCINFYDDMMHATIAIPLTTYGLRNKNLHGFEFGTCVLRCSSKSTFDEGYAGWLNWGQWMSSYTTKTKGVNTIILVDPEQGEITPSTEAPATEAPVTEAPATEAPATEAPATEAPATEAPVTEAPVTEAPVTEAPATEAPATEAPATEAPATEAPATEAPATEAPATEAPATEAPATEAPATEAPATEAPATEAPVTEAPATEAPVTEAPATEAPATEELQPETTPADEVPKVEEPAEKNNTGLIIAIVAVVVVVGAGLGIVLGKKKK